MNPIFICGFPKSGTTLVSQMFSNVPGIMLDTEIHLATFCLRMINDAITSGAVKTDLLDQMSVRLAELASNDFGLFYEYARQFFQNMHTGFHKGLRWGNNCKGTIDFTPIVRKLYPECTIIFMLRDPRDMWASVKNAKWPGQAQFNDIEFFKKRFRTVYDKSLVPDVITLLYRDIIRDPQIAFDLIGEKFKPEYLAGTGNVFRLRTLPLRWGETFEDGLIQTSDQRYKTDLTASEISQIEKAFPDIFDRYDFNVQT